MKGKRPVATLSEFPMFFGTVLFALEAIGVVSYEIFYIKQLLRLHFTQWVDIYRLSVGCYKNLFASKLSLSRVLF